MVGDYTGDCLGAGLFHQNDHPWSGFRGFLNWSMSKIVNFTNSTNSFGGCPFGNLAVEMSAHEPLIRHKIDRIFEDVIGRLQRTLDEAVEASDLSPMDTRETALALWAYYEGILILAKARQDLDLLKRLGQRAVRFLQVSRRHVA